MRDTEEKSKGVLKTGGGGIPKGGTDEGTTEDDSWSTMDRKRGRRRGKAPISHANPWLGVTGKEFTTCSLPVT